MTGNENRAVVCCLYDGDYHFGLGALVNSLYRNGFRGTVWAGFRGNLPSWARPLNADKNFHEFTVAPECQIRFVEYSIDRNFATAKSAFLLNVFQNLDPSADAVFFFDVDVVLKCRWTFMEDWVRQGIALCLDLSYPYMPATHPHRKAWRELAERKGYACRDVHGYVNSGFVGVHRGFMSFVRTWEEFVAELPACGISLDTWQGEDRSHPFCATDQDMLNVTAMATDVPLSIAGPDAMDFVPGGYIMSHAVLNPKPWRRNYIVHAVRVTPPATADKMYWRYADGPIRMYSPLKVAWKRAEVRLAALIGRFYRRT